MNRKRLFFQCILLALALVIFTGSSSGTPGMTAEASLERLKNGNSRAVAGNRTYPNTSSERVAELARDGQKPFVTILSCSDSRVPLEALFDAGYGDLFVIRVAGNVADVDEIGSIEYGAGHLGTPLVLVLGHTQCGAVTAVASGDKVSGSIPALVEEIGVPVKQAKTELPNASVGEVVERAIKLNVHSSMETILRRSPEMSELVKEGKASLIGAIYHLESGKIEWLGEHPSQAAILKEAEKEAPAHKTGSLAAWIIALVSVALAAISYLGLFNLRTRAKKLKAGSRLRLAAVLTGIECAGCVAVVYSLPSSGGIVSLLPALLIPSAIVIFGLLSATGLESALRGYVETIKARSAQ